MQVLTADHYARLQRLARLYQRRHAQTIKRHPKRNPRLAVDLLCFQPFRDHGGGEELLGALITPVSLSLALVGTAPTAPPEDEPETRWVALPHGRYPFRLETLDEGERLWRCALLDDLSDLSSLQEGNRLAQRLVERVMTRDEAPGRGA